MSEKEYTTPCLLCLKKESTGILIQMCDECMNDFEAKVHECKKKGEQYNPTREELACVHPRLRYKSFGGELDESTKVAFIKKDDEPTKIVFEKGDEDE